MELDTSLLLLVAAPIFLGVGPSMQPIGEASLAIIDVPSGMTHVHMGFAMAVDEAVPGSSATLLHLRTAIMLLVFGPAIVPVTETTVAINLHFRVDRDIFVDDLCWQVHLSWDHFGMIDGLGVVDCVCMWASNRCLPATVKAFGVRPSILEIVQAIFTIVRVGHNLLSVVDNFGWTFHGYLDVYNLGPLHRHRNLLCLIHRNDVWDFLGIFDHLGNHLWFWCRVLNWVWHLHHFTFGWR